MSPEVFSLKVCDRKCLLSIIAAAVRPEIFDLLICKACGGQFEGLTQVSAACPERMACTASTGTGTTQRRKMRFIAAVALLAICQGVYGQVGHRILTYQDLNSYHLLPVQQLQAAAYRRLCWHKQATVY